MIGFQSKRCRIKYKPITFRFGEDRWSVLPTFRLSYRLARGRVAVCSVYRHVILGVDTVCTVRSCPLLYVSTRPIYSRSNERCLRYYLPGGTTVVHKRSHIKEEATSRLGILRGHATGAVAMCVRALRTAARRRPPGSESQGTRAGEADIHAHASHAGPRGGPDVSGR